LIKSKITLFTILFSTLNIVYADGVHPGITSELVIRSAEDWSGTQLPPYLSNVPEIALIRFSIPPKTALPIHQHPSINAAYVMDGEITVVKEGGIERTFRKGEAIIEMVGKWHHGINRGTVPAELIVFYATTKDLPLAIKKE
jgi:quercetin dioxygenase-like cupin family protein